MQTGKIIKYVAITLAIVLIINIFALLFEIVSGFGTFLDFNDSKKELETKYDLKINSEDITNNDVKFIINHLDIELNSSKLTFKEADNFKIDTNNDNVVIKEEGNKISIKEKKVFLKNNKNSETIIYLPKGYIFDTIDIEMGAGVFNADVINVQKISFDMGAGVTTINYLNATKEADIETGAGKFTVKNSTIGYVDLDLGVGAVSINGDILGGDINAGIGSLDMTLNGTKDDYKFIINKGIGNIKINNESVSNGTYNYGNITFKIDGGIGTINVNTK